MKQIITGLAGMLLVAGAALGEPVGYWHFDDRKAGGTAAALTFMPAKTKK